MVVEVDTLSVGGGDDASVGVDDGTALTSVVESLVESVDVVATCARTGLTMANPIASATMIALAPTNVTTLVFIIKLIRLIMRLN